MNRLNGFFINRLFNKLSSVLFVYIQVLLLYLIGFVVIEVIFDN